MMSAFLKPLSFLVTCLSGWLSEHQQRAIEYLTERVPEKSFAAGV
jgi:hypothetical protein